MKISFFIILLYCVFFVLSCNQQKDSFRAFQSLIEAEKSFARLSAESGMRDAFMSYLAEEAIIFRPEPVLGRDKYANSPTIPGMLIWQPIFADISRDGKLGYTTGPWELHRSGKKDSADAYGHYVSIWKQQKDHSWKVVIDVGIPHPYPGYNLNEALLEIEHPLYDLSKTINKIRKSSPDVLLDLDRSFSDQAEGLGISRAFQTFAHPDLRLYRENALPLVGVEYALTYLTDLNGVFRWTPQAAELASSADLGYTFGTGEYRIETADSLQVERFSYLHIWKIDFEGNWKVVLDITNSIPSEAN